MATPPLNRTEQIERIKNRPLGVSPQKVVERLIKVHRCFSQRDGQVLPSSCSCKESVPVSRAAEMVTRGEADWTLGIDDRPTKVSVVVRRTTARVELEQRILAAKTEKGRRKKISKARKSGREAKHLAIAAAILWELQSYLRERGHEFDKADLLGALNFGLISAELQQALNATEYFADADRLLDTLHNGGLVLKLFAAKPLVAVKRLNRFLNPLEKSENKGKSFWEVMLQCWYQNKLAFLRLTEDAGFLTEAPAGQGQLVSGGYNVELIMAMHEREEETGGHRCTAANFKRGEGIYNPGEGPDIENEDDYETLQRRAEMHHK